MKKLVALFFLCINIFSTELAKQELIDSNQLLYLESHSQIKACVYTVLLQDNGSGGVDIGLGRGVVALLQEQLRVPIKVVSYTNLSELFLDAHNKECDLLPVMEETPTRAKDFDFTDSYLKLPLVMATKSGLPFINNVHILPSKKIAIVSGNSYIERMRQNYPNFEIIVVDSYEEGLDMVQREEVFGLLGFSQVLNYAMAQRNMSDLAITVQFDEVIFLSVATRNDLPLLNLIIQNAFDEIGEQKFKELLNEWLKLGYERQMDSKFLMQLLFFCIVLIGVFLYWHFYLKHQQKQKEQEQFLLMRQNRFAQMGEMVENISHQWRQPLAQLNSTVWILSMMLEKEKLNQKDVFDTQLEEIEKITTYMSKTIDHFKEFCHPDKSKESFSLNEVFEDSLLILKGALNSHGIKISFDIDNSIVVYNYFKELEHVIVIILNNAKDALVYNGIKDPLIEVKARQSDKFVTISICDNATGIKEQDIDKVFEPYFTTKDKSQNTGIGLYMAKTIVQKALDGDLSVRNSDNGACFEIKLFKGAKGE